MKITTQRKVLWAGNFALVFCLFGFVVLMAQNSPNARKSESRKSKESLKKLMEGEKRPQISSGADSVGASARLKTFQSKWYAGFIPPPTIDRTPKPTGPRQAPDLNSLIEIHMLMAHPEDPETAAVSIKIKSKPEGLFWYRVGEIIGVTSGLKDVPDDPNNELTQNDVQVDLDQGLKAFGGAKIVRIVDDGAYFEWAKKQVKVQITDYGEPKGFTATGKNIRVGVAGGGPGRKGVASKGGDASGGAPKLGALTTTGSMSRLTISSEGYQHINQNGDKLIEGISFESGQNAQGKRALKIKSLPAGLGEYGLRDGDTIVRIDSTPVTSKESIVRYVKKTHGKRKQFYMVTVLRQGKERRLQINVPRNPRNLKTPGGIRFGQGRPGRK